MATTVSSHFTWTDMPSQIRHRPSRTMVKVALHFDRLPRGDTLFDRRFGDDADNAAQLGMLHISRHFANHNDEQWRHVLFVFVARPLRSCLFAASNNFVETSNSSSGNWDTPGRENTSCTSRKAAARRFEVIGERSKCCALPSSLVGLLPPGPVIHLQGQVINVMP